MKWREEYLVSVDLDWLMNCSEKKKNLQEQELMQVKANSKWHHNSSVVLRRKRMLVTKKKKIGSCVSLRSWLNWSLLCDLEQEDFKRAFVESFRKAFVLKTCNLKPPTYAAIVIMNSTIPSHLSTNIWQTVVTVTFTVEMMFVDLSEIIKIKFWIEKFC